jgi:hypothetical protein
MIGELDRPEPGITPRRHYKVTFALLALAAVSDALLQSLVAPALPDIQHSLHTSVDSASWRLAPADQHPVSAEPRI